jgi:hypothetical protein
MSTYLKEGTSTCTYLTLFIMLGIFLSLMTYMVVLFLVVIWSSKYDKHAVIDCSCTRLFPSLTTLHHLPEYHQNRASPSEFLTFYRGTARLSMQRQCRIVAASPRRSFVSSSCRYSSGYTKDGKDNTHATKNKDQLDVQSANSASARGYVHLWPS